MGARDRRLRVAAGTAALALLPLAGCGDGAGDAATSTASDSQSSAAVASQPPLSASPPSETELSPGWDASPDGPAPTPDAKLGDAALKALLRTRATASDGPEQCGPRDVRAQLVGFDAAAGHRYTSLVVRNTSDRTCRVDGIPGLGARGEWGHRFTLTVAPGIPISDHAGPVTLKPGTRASAALEWTGELAGSGAERASMLVVQLASGQVPVRVPARLTGLPAGASDSLDVGMLSTLRISPFEAGD